MKLNGKIESRLRKGAAVSLCGALILAGVLMPGTAAFQNGRTVSYADETAKKTEEQVNAAFPDLSKVSKGTKGLSKSETVYMIMDADGKEKETLVSEWLRNPDGKDTIEDHSELTDIKNTSGDEEFTQNDDKLTWQAGGRDIKYTGSSDGIIPVSCEVTYSLNGEKMSASEIAGKSGEVEIRFDYYVTARDRVSANGNAYEMVHPYVMASGVVLNEDHFRDIEVNSGKVLSEEGNSVCLGIALPGMKENLGLKKDIIDIPESVVVKAVTDRFEIDGTYTVALTGLLDDVDISTGDASDKLDQLESAFGKLSSASSKLVSGSRKLANGADKLANGADKLAGGADELAGGAKKLKKGSKKLEDGTDSLAKGASRLANGTSQLKKNSGSLAEGIGQLAGGAEALSEGAGGLKTGTEKAVSGAKDLSDGLSALSGNSEALKAGTAMIENSVFEGATAQLQQALIAAGKDPEEVKGIKLTPSNYRSVLSGIPGTGDIKTSLDGVEQYVSSVSAYTDGVDSAAAGSTTFYSSLQALDEGAGQVAEGAEGLDAGLAQLAGKLPDLSKGIDSLDSGASEVSGGASKISKGMSSLSKGTSKLSKGASSLSKGSATLDSGMDQLSEGAGTLAKGMEKFDDGGIKKLVSSLDTDELDDMLGRFGALSKASKEHHFMDGTTGKIAGESKIIFKTGAVR